MRNVYHILINPKILNHEVPNLRQSVGWERRDNDYPALFKHCLFWAGLRDKNGSLIAFGYIVGPGIEHGYMEDIIVHRNYQGEGIGRALVQKLLKESQKRGISIVTVTFEEKNMPFYMSCGFNPCHGGVWRKK